MSSFRRKVRDSNGEEGSIQRDLNLLREITEESQQVGSLAKERQVNQPSKSPGTKPKANETFVERLQEVYLRLFGYKQLSMAVVQEINKSLIKFKTLVFENSDFKVYFSAIEEFVTRINLNSFDWSNEIGRIRILEQTFQFAVLVQEPVHYIYIDLDIIKEVLPKTFFERILLMTSIPFNSTESSFQQISRFYALMLDGYCNLYLKSILTSHVIIDFTLIQMSDPLFRSRVRAANRRVFNDSAASTNGVSFYEILKLLLHSHFSSSSVNFLLNSDLGFHRSFLVFVLTTLEYGLLGTDECDLLCQKLSSLTNMFVFNENQFIEQDAEYFTKHREQLGVYSELRDIVSEILLHLVTFYCDQNFEVSARLIRTDVNNASIFNGLIFERYSIVKELSLIVLSYLISEKFLVNACESYKQNKITNMIVNFFLDPETDFFENGFLVGDDARTLGSVGEVADAMDDSIEVQVRSRLLQVLDSLRYGKLSLAQARQRFVEIRQQLTISLSESKDRGLKTQLTLHNVPYLMVVLYTHINDQFDRDLIEVYTLLVRMVEGDTSGQALILGAEFQSILDQNDNHRDSIWLILLTLMFGNDFRVFDLQVSNFALLLATYKEHCKATVSELQVVPLTPRSKERLALLLLFNNFFHKLVKSQLTNADKRIKYDLAIVKEIVASTVDIWIPYLLDSSLYSQAKNVNLHRDVNDIIMLLVPEKLYSEAKGVTSDTLLFEVSVSFLRLFNISTYHLYTGETYMEVRKAITIDRFRTATYGSMHLLAIRQEFLSLLSNFFIFPSNHLITRRKNILGPDEVFLIEGRDLCTGHILAILTDELGFIEKTFAGTRSHEFRLFLTESFFPMVYKSLNGFVMLSKSQEIDQAVMDVMAIAKRLVLFLETHGQTLTEVMDKTKDKEEAETLLTETYDKEVTKLNSLNSVNLEKIIRMKFKAEHSSFFELSLMVREINIKINKLYLHCPENIGFIMRFRDKERVETSVKKSSKDETILKALGYITDFSAKPDSKSLNQLMRLRYLSKKVTYLRVENVALNGFLDILINDVLENNFIDSIFIYFMYMINNMENALIFEGFENSFFVNPDYLRVVSNFSRILKMKSSFIGRLYEIFKKDIGLEDMVHKQDAFKDNIFGAIIAQGEAIMKFNSNSYTKLFLSKIWSIYTSITYMCFYKNFKDKEWKGLQSQFHRISELFKSFSSKTFLKFNEYLNRKELGQIEVARFEATVGKRSIFYENFIYAQTLIQSTSVWKNNSSTIQISEDTDSLPFIGLVLDTVTEMLMGPNTENQLVIYEYGIDIWKGIVYRSIANIDSQFYSLKLSVINYLNSLIDGSNIKILTFLKNNLEVDRIFAMMIYIVKQLFIQVQRVRTNDPFYETSANVRIKDINELFVLYGQESFFFNHIVIDIVVALFIFVKNMSFNIQYYDSFIRDRLKDYDEQLRSNSLTEDLIIFKFINDIVISVDVKTTKDNSEYIQKHYFKNPQIAFFISKGLVRGYLTKAPFDCLVNKNLFLYESMEDIKLELESNKRMFEKYSKFVTFVVKNSFFYYQVFLIGLSVVINGLMLGFYQVTDNGLKSVHGSVNIVIMVLAIAVTVISFLCLLIWLLTQYTTEVKSILNDYSKRSALRIKKRHLLRIYVLDSLLFNKLFSVFFGLFLFSILGLTVSNVFYTLLPTVLFMSIPSMNNILKTMFDNSSKFIISLIIIFLVILPYSFALLTFFHQEFNEGVNYCSSYFECYVYTLNKGIRAGGGIGDTLSISILSSSPAYFWSRFFYDITFFVIIKLILINIISGIIIDNFGNLRDEMNARETDIRNNCFVCGVSRHAFDEQGLSFEEHIRSNHSILVYILFLIHITGSNRAIFKSLDYEIYSKSLTKDISWLPSGEFLQSKELIKKL